MSGGGGSSSGWNWNDIGRMFGGQSGSGQNPFAGSAQQAPVGPTTQTATNTPWAGMTWQQSMGLYPAGTFQGQTPAASFNPSGNLPLLAGGRVLGGTESGGPARANPADLFPNAAQSVWSAPGAQQPLQAPGAAQPFQAPNDYMNFANLAAGSGTLQPAPAQTQPAPATPTTNVMDYANMPAGSQ
jgi:hypothetical protein